MKKILIIMFTCGCVTLGGAFICFTAGALLSGTKWDIPDNGWFENTASLAAVIGMIAAALGGIPLLLLEIFGKKPIHL